MNWHTKDNIHEIWAIGSDGSDPHVVYALERAVDWIVAAWSPSDDMLACIYEVEGKHEGFVLDPAGGEPEWLGEDELFWHWLSDHRLWTGEWAAIESAPPAGPERWVSLESCEGVMPWQICTRDEESDEVMQLTHDLDFGQAGSTTWSPDGAQIVLNAGSGPDANGGYDHKLYLINADGSGLRQITEGETTDLDPSWSPDGEWIAFHRDCGLWLVHPDGSGAHEVHSGTDDYCVGGIAWSPDNQRIAFVDWYTPDDIQEIRVIGSDGSDPHVVYAFEQAVDWISVAWSPDGSRLAYIYPMGDRHEGFVLDPAGGEPHPIPEDQLPWTWYPNHWPQWSGGNLPSVYRPAPEDPWGLIVVPPGGAIGVGLVADFSGTIREIGPLYENAVRLAVEDQGQIAGFPVDIAVADGGCGEEMGVEAAQTMIGDPSVAGIVGHSCSNSCRTALPIYEEAHRVMISPSCTGTDLSTPGYAVFNRVVVQGDQGGDDRNREIVATDPYRDFAARYEQRYGQPLDSEELGFYAAYAYDAASILLEAIARVAVVDDSGALIVGRQSLTEAVRGIAGYHGVTGVIHFDDQGNRLP